TVVSHLSAEEVVRWRRTVAEVLESRIAADPDDKNVVGIECLANRALARKEIVCKLFVHDCDSLRIRRVLPSKVAALQQRYAHRLQVMRTDNILPGPAIAFRLPCNVEVTGGSFTANQGVGGIGSRDHARDGIEPRSNLLISRRTRRFRLVFRSERQIKQQKLLRLKSEWNLHQIPECLKKKPR